MSREEKGWAVFVITVFALVSIFVIFLGCVRSCGKNESENEPLPAAELVSAADEFRAPAKYEPEPEVVAEIPPRTYIGNCRLTVYNAEESRWGYQTATGATSAHLMTCAVDPSVIPYGSNVIVIDKDGEEHRFKAVDCGGFSGRWVDIFFDGRIAAGIDWLDECFGGEFAEVWIEEGYDAGS